jgi:ectoine hydroxylase-related dioxygenase (phytanoyl-CoA dioxygenase family)
VDALERDGYVIVRGFLGKDCVDAVSADVELVDLNVPGDTIFNPDYLRLQKPLAPQGEGSRAREAVLARCREHPVVSALTRGLVVADDAASVVISLPNCKQQPAHIDWRPNPDTWRAVKHHPGPLSLLVAVSGEAVVHAWPGTQHVTQEAIQESVSEGRSWDGGGKKVARASVSLDPGDCVLFSGFLVHAGSAYASRVTRVHVYFDKPDLERVRDATYIIGTECAGGLREDVVKVLLRCCADNEGHGQMEAIGWGTCRDDIA